MTYSNLIIPRIPIEDLVNSKPIGTDYLRWVSNKGLIYSSYQVLNPISIFNRFIIQFILPLN